MLAAGDLAPPAPPAPALTNGTWLWSLSRQALGAVKEATGAE
jgi:hypothetical protein